MSTCAMDDYLGAYVLAALEPDEVQTVRAHVAGCSSCAAEVAALHGTLSRLALLTLEDVEQALGRPPASPARLGRPGSAPRPHRARHRVGLIAAACALVFGVAGGYALSSRPPTPDVAATVQAADPLSQVTATLTVVPQRSVTVLHLSMRGAYPGGRCRLVVHARDGRTDTPASWLATTRGSADIDTRTPIPAAELQSIDIVTESGQRLIRLVMPRSVR